MWDRGTFDPLLCGGRGEAAAACFGCWWRLAPTSEGGGGSPGSGFDLLVVKWSSSERVRG